MSDQLRISDDGERCSVCNLPLDDHWLATCPENADVANPLTWDGEPLWSPDTMREGLFDSAAFQQLAGQTALDVDEPRCKKCGDVAVYPKYATPDLCEACHGAAWAHIDALNADRPGTPGNNVTNVWN